MIDYSSFERAIGLNWYEIDPDLQDIVKRYVPENERASAEAHLREAGALIGGPIAERAEMTDRNPPRLERFDRWGREVNRVIHHPGALATKRDLWELGRRRGEMNGRMHPVVGSASGYMLDQAETGMSCAIGLSRQAGTPLASWNAARASVNRPSHPRLQPSDISPHTTRYGLPAARAMAMLRRSAPSASANLPW